jgi:hypothetical protein
MGLGLVIRGVMSVPGIILLVMVVREKVVITGDRRYARMGEQRKGGLSAHPVVHHNVHGGEKQCQQNSTAYEAPHGERLGV